MRPIVITPYYKESECILRRCYESVQSQSVRADHLFVSNGFPLDDIKKWNVLHMILPFSSYDNGNTPRGLGAQLAVISGYDNIFFLDADNWYENTHVEKMIEHQKKGNYDVVASKRMFYTLTGNKLNYKERREEDFRIVDTSCFMFTRNSFRVLPLWYEMPKPLSPICDRIILQKILNLKLSISSTELRTVNFQSQYKSHYIEAGVNTQNISNLKTLDEFDDVKNYLKSTEGKLECKRIMQFIPVFKLESGFQ